MATLLDAAELATFKEHPPGEPEIWQALLRGIHAEPILLCVRDGVVETVLPRGARRTNRRPRRRALRQGL